MQEPTPHLRSIREIPAEPPGVEVIDQRHLPHVLLWEELKDYRAAADAIREMHVRGAPLIGVTAAYGMYLAALEAPEAGFEAFLLRAAEVLRATRPTAVNLEWALQQALLSLEGGGDTAAKRARFLATARRIAEDDVASCASIGAHGYEMLRGLAEALPEKRTLHVLTHCNAGWLACVEHGTATAPVYRAHAEGLDIHVWVDETRPRNQGARLTAWELGRAGIPHTVIADNTGGHLMQHGMVDVVIVGSDRTTLSGDVANKIGTYLKALAARDNGVPFYVALPSSTIDPQLHDGVREIPIEERGGDEVTHIQGWDEAEGRICQVRLTPEASAAANYGFDVTPARLVTGLITERGICEASEPGIIALFPEFSPLAAAD